MEWVWREFGECPNSLRSRMETFEHFNSWPQKQNICCSCVGVPNSTEFGESPSHSKHTPVPKTIKKNALHAYGFGASLERVWRISELPPQKKHKKKKWKKTFENIWVWTEFGEEFGESLENLQTHSKLTGKRLFDVNFHFFWIFFCKKKTKTKWVWRISKLSPNSEKICVHNLFLPFLDRLHAYFSSNKKLCTHIFLEFGESLEILQTHFVFVFLQTNSQKKWKLTSNKHFPVSLEWVWRFSKLSPNSVNYFGISLLQKNDYKMSLENLHNLSKLSPNSKKNMSAQTFYANSMDWLHAYVSWKKICTHIFWSLERVWRFSKLILFSFFFTKKSEKMKIDIKQTLPCKCRVSLEILQTLSKLGPNSQGHVCLMSIFFFFVDSFFFSKKPKTKWVWRISKLSPNSKKYACKNFFAFFTDWLHAYSSWRKLVHAFFLSLERVWRFSKSGAHANKGKNVKIDIKQTFLCELQTLSKLICSVFVFFFDKERSELEYSPNSFETHLSLEHQHTKNRMFFVVRSWNFQSFAASLEWVWRFSKLTPNSNVFGLFLLFFLWSFFWWERSEFQTSTHKKRTCFPRCPKHIYILLWSKGEIFKVWLRVKSLDPSSLQNHLSLEHKPTRQQIFFLTGENQNFHRLVYTSGVILILLFYWKAQRQTNTNMYPKARLEAFKDLSVSDFG